MSSRLVPATRWASSRSAAFSTMRARVALPFGVRVAMVEDTDPRLAFWTSQSIHPAIVMDRRVHLCGPHEQIDGRDSGMGIRLQGKTALVTGATSNIGRAIAIAFGGEGAHVVVGGRDRQRGSAVVEEALSAGGRADFVAASLDGTAQASSALAAEATRLLGRIDVLVNSAGIFPGSTTAETNEATFDRVYAVNVKAPFFLTAAVAPAMAERGSGAIINLGSWIARLGIPIGSLYSSTKGAVENLTRAWAAEFE